MFRSSHVGLGLSLLAIAVVTTGCDRGPAPSAAVRTVAATSPQQKLEKQIDDFCGGCHEMPRPSSFPKHAWAEEVEQGFELFELFERSDLKPVSPKQAVVDYFSSRAPYNLEIPSPRRAATPAPVVFRPERRQLRPGQPPAFISNILATDGVPGHSGGLLLCDMKQGHLLLVDPNDGTDKSEILATFDHPAHVHQTDLDDDGTSDYLVSDLGSFIPEDHRRGKLYWLSRDGADWSKTVLLEDVGRVCSVDTADFNGDGQTDIIVAEFGWRKTGSIHLLTSTGIVDGVPSFDASIVDQRNGAIHVHQCHLNGDGKLDFVALVSQEHEEVVAFENRGGGIFAMQTIWRAGYPSYGSSGIELADMDGDGDTDVLYVNGDSFDDAFIKPYHSVQWLENDGGYPYRRHEMAAMPGVHRALPGDFDGDGDVDVVAVSLLPNSVQNRNYSDDLDSVILLERTEHGSYLRHSIESRDANHATVEVGDFDGDSDLDLAVGVFWNEQSPGRLTLWWNQQHP